jgi:hypothetical protein
MAYTRCLIVSFLRFQIHDGEFVRICDIWFFNGNLSATFECVNNLNMVLSISPRTGHQSVSGQWADV